MIFNDVAYLTSDLEEADGIVYDRRNGPTNPPNPVIAYGGARI